MTDYTGTYFTVDGIDDWLSKGVDANGVRWTMTDLTGWDEPPDSRLAFTPRVAANGSFDAPVYDDVRVISWMGLLQAPDRATREAMKLTLARVARALRDGADLIGHDESGDFTVHAKRSPGWKIAPFGPLGLQYQAAVTCPDPYKYGPVVTETTNLPTPPPAGLAFPLFTTVGVLDFGLPGDTGQVTLFNPGTTDAFLTFTITGPVLGGFTLTDVSSGRQIAYAGDVATGAVVLIVDSATGRATLNGADRTGELTSKQWWSVPAGGSSTVQFATSGASGQTGTLTASMAPAYQ